MGRNFDVKDGNVVVSSYDGSKAGGAKRRRDVTAKLPKGNAAHISALIKEAAREELATRRALPEAVAAMVDGLLPWQRRFVDSTARRKELHCGRRSGKTHVMEAAVFKAAAAFPRATIPVFERTTTCRAAVVMWKGLQEASERFGLDAEFHHSLMRCTLPNRAEIVIVGADTVEAADKARGDAYPAAFVDEAGTFRPQILEYLTTDVLPAALLDYQGSLTMAGTPPPRYTAAHPFYMAATGDDWEHYHSTLRENIHIPLLMAPEHRAAAREAELEDEKRRHGWTDTTPRFMREWLGLFVQDNESLLYRLGGHNHEGVKAPDTKTGRWYYGLGVDFGYNDPCAFVVVAWRRGDARMWVLESYQAPHLIPSAVAAHIERLRVRYDFRFIIGDTGGAGKPYTEELRQKYGIPIEAARKRGKQAYLEMLNGDLASGQVQVVERSNEDLIADLYTVRRDPETGWAEDGDHDATHLPDALRYTITEVHAVQGLGDPDKPEKGTVAYAKAEEARMERLLVEAALREANPPQAPGGYNLDDAVNGLPRGW